VCLFKREIRLYRNTVSRIHSDPMRTGFKSGKGSNQLCKLGISILFTIVSVCGQADPLLLDGFIDLQLELQGESVERSLVDRFTDPDVLGRAVAIDFQFSGLTQTVYIAMLEGAAPVTVNNFIRYIEAGRFAENFIHRLVPGFIVQGGGFYFETDVSILPVPTFDPITNEPGVSNLRGTLAMAKIDGDPDSATSGWFINLGDNSANLDSQNSGFTVFAEVIGDGMDVVDQVAALPFYDARNQLGSPFGELPLTNSILGREFFVETNARKVSVLQYAVASSAPEVVSVSMSTDSFTLIPSLTNAGQAIISVTATDLEGRSSETSFSVEVRETYASWLNLLDVSFADSVLLGRVGSTGDPDGDGQANLLEWVFGGNPVASDRLSGLPEVFGGDSIQFTYGDYLSARLEVKSGSDFPLSEVLWSSDFGFEHPAVQSVERELGKVTVTLKDPTSSSMPDRLFWQLGVELID